jgi:hypothetical protein
MCKSAIRRWVRSTARGSSRWGAMCYVQLCITYCVVFDGCPFPIYTYTTGMGPLKLIF